MYESWFRLSKRPFHAPPQTAEYFAEPGMDSAREALLRCIQRNSGPAIVVGQHGTGKTLMSLLLERQCQAHANVAHITAPGICSRKELLQTILFELGLPYNLVDEGQLRLSLIDFLSSPNASSALLLIDDAHDLNEDLLEQIASLSDIVRSERWCFNLILFGLPSLEDRLARPSLASLNQRLASRQYLRNWNRATTIDYIRFQLNQAGGAAEQIFDVSALDTIYDLSDGTPRLVNQLCDHALILGCLAQFPVVTRDVVSEAWADIQAIPYQSQQGDGPQPHSPAGESSVVEFGTLSDLDEPTSFGSNDSSNSGTQAVDQQAPVDSGAEAAFENSFEGSFEPDFGQGHPAIGPEVTQSVTAAQGFVETNAIPGMPWPAPNDQPAIGSEIEIGRFETEPSDPGGDMDGEALFDYEYFDATADQPVVSPSPTSADQDSSRYGAEADVIFDQIEHHLAAAQRDEPRSPSQSPPPVNVTSNPFLEQFEEEEVVLKRSATLNNPLVRQQPTVSTVCGAEIIESLRGNFGSESNHDGHYVFGHLPGETSDDVRTAVENAANRVSSARSETGFGNSTVEMSESFDAFPVNTQNELQSFVYQEDTLDSEMTSSMEQVTTNDWLGGGFEITEGRSTGDQQTEPEIPDHENDVIISGFNKDPNEGRSNEASLRGALADQNKATPLARSNRQAPLGRNTNPQTPSAPRRYDRLFSTLRGNR